MPALGLDVLHDFERGAAGGLEHAEDVAADGDGGGAGGDDGVVEGLEPGVGDACGDMGIGDEVVGLADGGDEAAAGAVLAGDEDEVVVIGLNEVGGFLLHLGGGRGLVVAAWVRGWRRAVCSG